MTTPAYLLDMETNERFEFQYNPPEIQDQIKSGWIKLLVPGATHPRLQWAAGGGRTWSFKVQFYRETSDHEEVSKKVRFLQSLMYPKYSASGDLERGPAVCMFGFGSLYKADVIIDQCAVKYYKLFSPDDLQPIIADVDLKLEEFRSDNVSFDDVRAPGNGTV